MEIGKAIVKQLLLIVLLALVARTVHAQAAPCNPYIDPSCVTGAGQPGVSPYAPGYGGGPIGGLGPYSDPNNPRPYDLSIPVGVPMTWTINGQVHLDGELNRLGWIVLDNLDNYAQTVTVEFTSTSKAPFIVQVDIAPKGRGSVSVHDYPNLTHGYYSATAYFQRVGHAYATFADSCTIGADGEAQCAHSRDVGSVLVPRQ